MDRISYLKAQMAAGFTGLVTCLKIQLAQLRVLAFEDLEMIQENRSAGGVLSGSGFLLFSRRWT